MKKSIDVYKDALVIANSRYIEIMCAAYLKETDIPASEVMLVQQINPDGVKFWFERKR